MAGHFDCDAQGQKIAASDNNSALLWTHDAANRMATAEMVGELDNAQPAILLTHDCDAVGNRTASDLSANYTAGTANRLIEDDDACHAYGSAIGRHIKGPGPHWS